MFTLGKLDSSVLTKLQLLLLLLLFSYPSNINTRMTYNSITIVLLYCLNETTWWIKPSLDKMWKSFNGLWLERCTMIKMYLFGEYLYSIQINITNNGSVWSICLYSKKSWTGYNTRLNFFLFLNFWKSFSLFFYCFFLDF